MGTGYGQDQGSIITPEKAAQVQALNPHITAIALQGARHNVHRENFSGFIEVVKTFLAN